MKLIKVKTIVNNALLYLSCGFIIVLFIIFNFEIPMVIYKLSLYIIKNRLKCLYCINSYNLFYIFKFFIITILLSFLSFVISGAIVITICFFNLQKVYAACYAINNVLSIWFTPTLIFILYIYNLPLFILFILLMFQTIFDLIILAYEFFSIEISPQIMLLNQFTKSIFAKNAKKKFLITTFFSMFKSMIFLYFIEFLDNAYIYAFAIRTPLFLSMLEDTIQQTNLNSEFVIAYFVLQFITYVILGLFALLVKI